MAQPEARDDWELQVETCRVELWRGYVTSTFIARLVDGEDVGAVVESSSSFRCRSSRPPETQEARLAHYELVSRLKGAGWSPTGVVGEWFETELARPTLVPPQPQPGPVDDEPVQEPEPPPLPVPVVEERPAPPPSPAPSPAPVAPAAPRDRWRAIAVAGLLAAVALLVFLALHGVG